MKQAILTACLAIGAATGLSATNTPAVKAQAKPQAAATVAKEAPANPPKAKLSVEERKAEARLLAARRKFEARLEEITKAFGRYPHASRHRYPGQIFRAAVLLETVEDKERAVAMRRELLGDGTTADKAFGLFRDLLHGELQHAFELYELLPQARWYETAIGLRRADDLKKGGESIHDAIAMLHLLSLCGRYVSSSTGKISIKAVVDGRDGLQDKLIDLLRDAAKSGKRDEMFARFRASFRYALRAGRLDDPKWLRLLSDLTKDSGEQLEMLRSLRYAEKKGMATDLAQWATEAHPADGGIAIEAYDALQRGGKHEAAFLVMLTAEENVPYPDRRRVRMHYLRTLRYSRHKSGSKRQPAKDVMTYDEERRERQYAAIWADDLEAQMAMGDVHATERETQDALAAYRHVFSRTKDPGMRWSAWLAWAEFDAQTAWSHRDDFTNLLQNAENALRLGCAVALAADGPEGALAWVRERFEDKPTGDGADGIKPILAALSWINGDETYALGLVNDTDDRLKGQVVSTILGMPRGQIAPSGTLPAGLILAITHNMARCFDREDCWASGTRLALALVPSYKTAEGVVATWQRVAQLFPSKAGEAAQASRMELTGACLAWVDGRPEDDTALRVVLQGAALHVYRGYDRRGEGNATDLFFACLERASARELPATTVTYSVSYFTKALKKSKTAEETVASYRQTIARLYPELAPKD